MQIIDDVVDKETQDLIEDLVLGSDKPRWVYHRGYNTPKRIPPLTKEISSPSFFFEIVRANNNTLVDPSYDIFLKPIEKFNPRKIFKVRATLHHALKHETRTALTPHLDALPEQYGTDEFKVAVYYVNESTGPTVFYKETYQTAREKNLSNEQINNYEMEVDKIVEPKKGRIILFNHDQFHSTGVSQDGIRSIINYNFI